MILYFFQRLVWLVAIVVLLSVLVFAITQILPGNAAIMILGNFRDPEVVAALEKRLGLDAPVIVQYWNWASGFLHGDMGISYVVDRPIAPMLLRAFGNTMILALLAMLCVTVIGIAAGVAAAVRRGGATDNLTAVATYAGISLPEFFWAILLILIFSGYLGLLPSSGRGSFSEDPLDWARHLVLPVVTLTIVLLAHVARVTRSSMLEVLDSNYVRAARAKGLPERVVIVRHALRDALLPTVTVLSQHFTFLIGEVVVIETVFAYPGFGRLTVDAIQDRDLPLIQACGLCVAVVACLANLIADMVYAFLDPRIRYGGGRDV